MKKPNHITFSLIALLGLAWTYESMAQQSYGLGALADGLMLPVAAFGNALYVTALVLGIALLGGTVVRYFEHRRNSMQVRFSQVVTMFILGVMLVLLALISKYIGVIDFI